MKRQLITKNFIFRFYKCGLSIEQTAELCFKSVRTVTNWDRGKPIPKECKRLMRLATRHSLHHSPRWEGFEMREDRLKIPTGRELNPEEIITAIQIMEMQSSNRANPERAEYLRFLKTGKLERY